MSTSRSVFALTLAAVIWVPSIHAFFGIDDQKLARSLEAQALERWSGTRNQDASDLRRSNAEWDFMARTYTVLALANHALATPAERDRALAAIDAIIERTLELEEEHGPYYFLMAYAQARPFVAQPTRSIFVDGEIALMLGARRLVKEDQRWASLHRARAASIVERMKASPTLSAESYPDEAWTFCNSVALASLRILDVLDGTDHSQLFADWLAIAKAKLVDAETGLLISSYHLDGTRLDGPEGSSLFMVAHCLQLIDPAFAEDQWARASVALGRTTFGFGYAREWPKTAEGSDDIDSGPTVPFLDANAGASGLMILGAAAFGDLDRKAALLRSLELAAFPIDDGDGRRYRASNTLGDAVLLYALEVGPLWAAVDARSRKDAS